MVELIPSFGGVLGTVLAFVVALSVIVAIHEYGHYIVGRWCGIHAEVFSLGFGPVIWSRADRHGTVWQIALLPFGGYVRFLGDANAASGADGEALAEISEEDLKRTIHGAALWRRSATVAAGPVFNFILSILVFGGLALSQGVTVEEAVLGKIKPLPDPVTELREGDRILAMNGIEVSGFDDFAKSIDLIDVGPVDYRIARGDQVLNVTGPYPRPPRAEAVRPGSAADDVGIKEGDYIFEMEGQGVQSFRELIAIVTASEGRPLTVRVWRDGTEFDATLVARRSDEPKPDGGFETRWLLGIVGDIFFEPVTETPGVFEAVRLGAESTWRVIRTSLSGLMHVISGAISTCNLQGPIGIAETSGQAASQGIVSFISFIAVLSTAVGLLNLFPIPVLDGGHLVFHAYEAVAGRPPNDKVLRILFALGLGLILTLMIFALSNDLFCP